MKRLPRGEAHHSAKLTEAQVRSIRQQWTWRGHDGGKSTKELALEYGVCKNTIFEIVNHIAWCHIK